MSQVTIMNRISLTDIDKGWPELRRFDNLKIDGYVTRNNITAVADDDRGLCFELPTPPSVKETVGNAWRNVPEQARLLTATPTEQEESLSALFNEPDMQYPVLTNQAPANLILPDNLRFDYTEHMLKQMSRLCGLESFKDLQREANQAPEIAAARINKWFQDKGNLNKTRKRIIEPASVKHFARCFVADPQMLHDSGSPWALRALMSDRFRVIDTTDILSVLFGLLGEKKDKFPPGQVELKVSFNDAQCWFVVTNKAMTKATKVGDTVCARMRGGTSDVGTGSAKVETSVEVLACTNGMTTGQSISMRHLGRKSDDSDQSIFSERTKAAQQATLLMELHDAMEFAFDEVKLEETVRKMDENQANPVSPEDAPAIFEAVRTKLSVAEPVKDALFSQFLREHHENGSPNRSQDGVVQAITDYGRKLADKDYEKAMPLEDLGGKIHSFSPSRFASFVNQAKSDPRRAAKMI